MIDYENTAICWACGKEKHVNVMGFCEDCWIAHVRKPVLYLHESNAAEQLCVLMSK